MWKTAGWTTSSITSATSVAAAAKPYRTKALIRGIYPPKIGAGMYINISRFIRISLIRNSLLTFCTIGLTNWSYHMATAKLASDFDTADAPTAIDAVFERL